MRLKRITLTAWAIFFLVCIRPVAAVELIGRHSAEFEQAKQHNILMAELTLLLVKGGKEQPIAPNYELRSGDRIRLKLTTSVDSEYRLFVLTKPQSQNNDLLLKGQTKASMSVMLPKPEQGILELDGKPGVDWLKLVVRPGSKPQRLKSSEPHPYGKIKQVILRNIELSGPKKQKIDYSPLHQAIYISFKEIAAADDALILTLGLTHRK